MEGEKISFRRHCSEISTTSFCCGDAEIDKWFRAKSLKDHDKRKHIVTCVHAAGDDSVVIGFYALSTVIEEAGNLPGVFYVPFFGNSKYFPCLSMVYLAVRQDQQRQGIGSAIMVKVILDFADYGEQIGLPLLILTPLNSKVAAFYESLGFERYRRGVGMFLPLQTAIDMREGLVGR
ncbi:GNAT family N-acetyltransferase [Sphingobium sp. Ant17]|uniref:GNAT family N-acetyltransferase n=1 Tax=Sphingobium sp. Ant17 TaxID=1461752 RepID=UPI0009E0ABC6|nr:GNAT family N-acetyltransferase [Sphingobium sp. Ant17]